jgi:hypothetical protein
MQVHAKTAKIEFAKTANGNSRTDHPSFFIPHSSFLLYLIPYTPIPNSKRITDRNIDGRIPEINTSGPSFGFR